MPPTGPFLLPDGRHLAAAFKHSDKDSEAGGERMRKNKTTKRGKDLQLSQILHQQARIASAGLSQDASELRALEAVGVRRRRRWLNDRILRDLSGPMTHAEMERQFKPVPFGWREPSALEIIAQPEHAGVWDGFRNIDPDKEARVLQKWEAYNQEQVAAGRPHTAAASSTAAQALSRWSCVSKKARMALRKAKIHTVLALELQVLEFIEAGTDAALSLSGLDGWGRLLVHGLADFYGLRSAATSLPACSEGVEAEEQDTPDACREGLEAGGDDQDAAQHPVLTVWHPSQEAPGPQPCPDITCTDVLLALAECRTGSISVKELQTFVKKHIHGSEASHAAEDWVMV